MTLGARRSLFTGLLADLIGQMRDAGFEPRIGEVQRAGVTALLYGYGEAECDRIAQILSPEFSILADEIRKLRSVMGAKRSVHVDALAADIVLCASGGVPLTKTSDHEPFGLWWEKQHPYCCWGGRFGDGGHYSVTPDGVRK